VDPLTEKERLSRIFVNSDTKNAIRLIATLRNMTITEVAEEYLCRSGIKNDYRKVMEKIGGMGKKGSG
jgi:hypothetical protein